MPKTTPRRTFEEADPLRQLEFGHVRWPARDRVILYLVAVHGLAIRQVVELTDADLRERPSGWPARKAYRRRYLFPAYQLTIPPLPPAGRLRTHPLASGTVLEFDQSEPNELLTQWLLLRKQRHGIPLPGTASPEAQARQPLFITERGTAFTYSGVYRVLDQAARDNDLTARDFLSTHERRKARARMYFQSVYEQSLSAAGEKLASGKKTTRRK
jgi:hypothetical protein